VTATARAAIAIGTRIGPYEITGWLGAGGMGDVYRARDPRLGREVAIKVIPEIFAADPSRLQRFEQEARAAGQLNHPNILAVLDVGVDGGAPYIVSELLDGESLRSRLAGGALPPRKALDYARQIANGLAAAHDRKIVHRDIKPDNLFVTSDGRVKILDFGIAKLTAASDDDARPTIAKTETAPGTVVGTASYMSPEQVRGEIVDHRSDLFSLGTVLHEMLTGRAAFARETGADTMAAVLKEEPAELVAADVPPALARIVSRCLEKSREMRFQSARDLAFALEVLTGTGTATAALAAERPRWFRRHAVPWVAAGALAAALAIAVVLWAPWQHAAAPVPLRLSIELGADVSLATLNTQFGDAAVISPDGATMAFVAQKGDEGRPQIYVQRLTQLQATPLPGTDDALTPFFSPDGQWIGFFSQGPSGLKKIAVTGGATVMLADAPSPRGGAWGEDDTIVFAPDQLKGTRLLRVSSGGGKAEPITALADGEVVHSWPQILPGGKAMLYTATTTEGGYNDANLIVQHLAGGTRKVVQRGGYHGRYLPSGHLVYIHDGTLFAAPFDLDRLEVTGPPVRALEGMRSNSITGGAQFSVSANGTLMYLPGLMTGAGSPLSWMDRSGKTTTLRSAPANWLTMTFSPDGRRLAAQIRANASSDIWVDDIARDTLTRLTADPGGAGFPVWTPDGGGIVFTSGRADQSASNLYWQRADGAGEAQRLTESKNVQHPYSWHRSGKFLAFEEAAVRTNWDVMILPMEGDDASGWKPGTPTVFANGPSYEVQPAFSPDGRWLAYASNESGTFEIFVRPFPGPGGKTQISSGGGNFPTWSRTKPEIFYGVDGRIMVAPFSVNGDAIHFEKPALWSESRYQTRGASRMFALHPDGERFAFSPAPPTSNGTRPDKVALFFNFFDELRRIAPAARR
jgi:Tol biopolymer transport system component